MALSHFAIVSGRRGWKVTISTRCHRCRYCLPVFSLISHRTWNSAGRMRWQFNVCFLQKPSINCSCITTDRNHSIQISANTLQQLVMGQQSTVVQLSMKKFHDSSSPQKSPHAISLLVPECTLSKISCKSSHYLFSNPCNWQRKNDKPRLIKISTFVNVIKSNAQSKNTS